ncbi:MAG TPA: molybdopterin-dependent oxidoreductase [Usitatibacter sp.]|nr:molybdopterin-dependent oxidoreductase [Usitatibacter sp.]
MAETRTTCCYCGTGCGVMARTEGGRIVEVRGDPDHPSNRGRLCTKGSTLHLTMTPQAQASRARYPELRRDRRAARERCSWDEALDHVAARFAAIIGEHGPDAVAFYVSGQLLTEDYYVFNKLAKGLIGTANIDTNSRLCMSSAVSGYVKTLGADAPPACYDDIEQAQCLFIAGSNTAFAHPVLHRRIEAARERNPRLKTIVVDPRRTQTAESADLHLAILPGTDVALFHGMLHAMLWERLTDDAFIEAHTDGFDALRDLVRDYPPERAAQLCGVRAEDIVTAARWFARSRATLSLYCQGLNQSSSGTAKNASLVNLHLATGHVGRAGAGPFSLTGQPNAMGGREVGALATQLAAHRDLDDAGHRAEIARAWGVDRLPSSAGLTAVELFDALAAGRVKAVWIACTNPAQSLPDLPRVHAALQAAELVVVQEACADTETASFADVLLPATSWGEKEGTVTNSERRISRVRAAVPKPWEARHDWEIVCEFARRLEGRFGPGPSSLRDARGDGPSLFPYTTPEEIWNEHRETTRGRDLDITGLGYDLLDSAGPQHWPFPEGARTGRERLYGDGVFPTPDGRARFYVEPYKPVAEPVSPRYPLRLTTGRLRDQWHGMTRTGTVAALFGHAPEPRLALSPGDLERRGLRDGDIVRVESARGALHVIVEGDESVRRGQAYLPMHWGKRFLGGRDSAGVNTITCPATDPVSRQPELKHAAVRVTGVELPWRLVAFAEMDASRAAALLRALQPLQEAMSFMSAVPMGRERAGLLVRAASDEAPGAHWLPAIDALLGLDGDDVLRYEDARRGHSRRIRISDERLLAVRLTGDPGTITSGEWLREWQLSARPVADVRRLLLSPATHAPSGFVLSGRVVCQCANVREPEIVAALGECRGETRERLQALGARLNCGTHCGSCTPELRALAARVAPKAGKMVA